METNVLQQAQEQRHLVFQTVTEFPLTTDRKSIDDLLHQLTQMKCDTLIMQRKAIGVETDNIAAYQFHHKTVCWIEGARTILEKLNQ